MSFTDTLTLDNATGVDTVYALITRDNTGTKRLNTATSLTEPDNLVIKHSSSGVGANAIDRHLIQFSRTNVDAVGVPRTAIVNFTIAQPRSAALTNAEVIDLVSNLIDLISDGTFSGSGIGGTVALTQLLRGES